MNDRGELLPNVRSGLPKDEGHGFLRWQAEDAEDEADFADRVAADIEAVDERGCGYEAPLEVWYRFLVDPDFATANPYAYANLNPIVAVDWQTLEVDLDVR